VTEEEVKLKLESVASTRNIIYQQFIVREQQEQVTAQTPITITTDNDEKNNFSKNPHLPWKNVFTIFPNNNIENSPTIAKESERRLEQSGSSDSFGNSGVDTLENNELKKFKCFYCDECFASDLERIKHIDNEHHGKLYYPTPEDFYNREVR
jgi:hypothetical protein